MADQGTGAELQELRRALGGMAALSSLPALWLKSGAEQIAVILAEALLPVLDLDGVHITVNTESGEPVKVERNGLGAPPRLGELIRAAFADDRGDASAVRELTADGLRGTCVWLGTTGDGRLYAVSARPLFPTEAERLAISMAANQAAVALQRARAEAALRAETAALDREREAVSALNRTLANERNQLRRLFEQAPGFMALLSGPEHVFEMCNASYVRLAGERDFIGRTVRDVFPDLQGQGFFELLDEAYASGKPHMATAAPVDIERTPGGSPERRYIDFVYQPIFDAAGKVTGIFAEGHDVTEQALAAEHRLLLVNELNHRVKNTLATVQSMAHQTLSGAESLLDAKTRLTSRLVALSNAHNVLTEENWRGAEVGQIIGEAVRPHDDAVRPRVNLKGEPTQVNARTALALSMALHELATNAVKYGALSNEVGEVDIRWRQDDLGYVILEWRERSGPVVSTPTRRGFGSRLLMSGLAVELGASATLDYAPTGVTCQIRAPLVAGEGDFTPQELAPRRADHPAPWRESPPLPRPPKGRERISEPDL